MIMAACCQVELLEAELRDVRREWTEDIASLRREGARAAAEAQQAAAQGSNRASAAAAERQAGLEASLHEQRAAFQVRAILASYGPPADLLLCRPGTRLF